MPPSDKVAAPRSKASAQKSLGIHVRSSRFGDFEIGEDQVLRFSLGLAGFPQLTAFVILEHRVDSPFKWLQAIEHADANFLVIDPTLVVADFPVDRVRPALEFCDLEAGEEVAVLAICCVPAEPSPATVNLMAPIGLGLRSRRGAQIIVRETGFGADEPLVLRAARSSA